MSGIFDEKNMMQALEKYLPEGETLAAGVHGIGIQTEIKQVFGKCAIVGGTLVPDENGTALEVKKCKYAKYDVYIGLTQRYLILAECEVYKHYYEFNDAPELKAPPEELGTAVPIQEIGTCFPLAEIQSCVIKNAWMGAVSCCITMNNGSFLKLMLPKRAGAGGGMPLHAQYREEIIARLRAGNA